MYTQPSTSPKRQYVATAIFAILAMVSGLSVVTKNNSLTAQTVSYTSDQAENGHSQTLEELALQAHLRTSE